MELQYVHSNITDLMLSTRSFVYLHLHEEVLRFPPLEAVLSELPAHPLDLSALRRRTELSIKLPDSPAEEVIPGA